MELIDKKALIDDLMKKPIEIQIYDGNNVVGVRRIYGEYLEQRINEQPVIDAAPVVHGTWIDWSEVAGGHFHSVRTCSNCGFTTEVYGVEETYKFCPVCSAVMDSRMDGDDE